MESVILSLALISTPYFNEDCKCCTLSLHHISHFRDALRRKVKRRIERKEKSLNRLVACMKIYVELWLDSRRIVSVSTVCDLLIGSVREKLCVSNLRLVKQFLQKISFYIERDV